MDILKCSMVSVRVFTSVRMRMRTYVCAYVCPHCLVSYQVSTLSQSSAVRNHLLPEGFEGHGAGPFIHSFIHWPNIYLLSRNCLTLRTNSPAREDRQVTRQMQCSVKNAAMGTFGGH